MRHSFFVSLMITLFLCLSAGLAGADEKKFIIMPFAVNAPQSYNHLSRAVPGTLQGKLSQQGVLAGEMGNSVAKSDADATKAMRQANADYGIWGVVNVVGNDCTLEVHSVDRNGKSWSTSSSGPLSGLTGTVQNMASALGREALGVQVAGQPVFRTGPSRTGALAGQGGNSDIIVNDTGQQVYLNPQFRYQGADNGDGSRIRSQRLRESISDMALGDFNGDGKTEIAVLTQHKLTIYIWQPDNTLKSLGEQTISATDTNFSMRAMDVDKNGAADLVICTFQDDNSQPYSYIYSFQGNKFTPLASRIPYFASVLRLPPNFEPVLVGQRYDQVRLFEPGVRQLVRKDGKYELGTKIALPAGANVFNVAWIPAGRDNPQDMLVMLNDDEKLKVFQGSGNKLIHTTMDNYSGSAVGMEYYKIMPGLGMDRENYAANRYFAPMRLIAADIGNTGENVLLLNRPISTAGKFFQNYRYFPQGEIHALYWDGVGMGLKWKTRRIRGSVAEIDLGDVNNDGILDLVVAINTSPELGIGSRSSMITAYPLDVTRADPNTPPDMSEFETTPN